jgi:hypothetical protein
MAAQQEAEALAQADAHSLPDSESDISKAANG